jgi:transposase
MHPQNIPDIPQQTVEVARASFPKGNIYMKIRDTLGSIFEEEVFADLFPQNGQPAYTPWRLALVCIMQFMENLSDRQAADAVRGHIDWKYVLSLALTDSGFDYSILSEFRTRLLAGGAEQKLLDILLHRLKESGLLKTHRRQRTDSTHVLGAIRTLNRLETLGEGMRVALDSLAVAAPDWLATNIQPDWFDRYGRRVENYRLPKLDSEREALGSTIGADGLALLDAIYDPTAPQWLRQIPGVETLRQIWVQQFYAPEPDVRVKWRTVKDMPPSTIAIHSPHDVEAHYSSKRSIDWVGYKVHMTEICDEDSPRFITNVHTTLSTITDEQAVEPIHSKLEEKDLLPDEHLLDGGYPTAENLVNSLTQYNVEIIGPVRSDPSWQTKAQQGFDSSNFQIDWDNEKVTCPQGHQSTKWLLGLDVSEKPVIRVRFNGVTCRNCPVRSSCTKSKTEPRELTFLPQVQHIALQTRRQTQQTPEWKATYNQRAGIESTHSQGIRRSALRQSRYIGLKKTHLMQVFIACALNLVRLDAWLNGIPLAKTRSSRFKQLQPQGD